MANLAAVIAAEAQRRPAAPAIVSPAGTMGYRALDGAVRETAAALLGQGVRPGRAAGLLMDDGPTDLVLLLALFRLGVPALPLSPQETPAERRTLLDRVAAACCIGARAHRGTAEAAYVVCEDLSPATGAADLPAPPDADTVAYYNRSSGTTLGRPKLIAVTHAQRWARDGAVGAALGRHGDDRHLHVVTLANSFGRGAATATLQAGGAVVFPPPLHSVDAVAAFARRAGITAAALSPPYVRDLLRAPAAGLLLPGVRLVVGTAALTRAERRQILERITPLLYIAYGTNETGSLAVAAPGDLALDIDSVGRPFPGIEAAAVGDDLRPLPPGSPGELRFRHPSFPRDYVAPEPGSTSRFRDGWFYPGDAGSIDGEGRITLLGRVDDVINVGGRKVHPSAIESWLAAHPAVVEATVMAARTGRQGQQPVAAVVLRMPVTEDTLMAFCRARGGSLPMPRRIVALPALPRNAAGKVDRPALAALLAPHLGG
ncbi:MAG: acyl--CoA ligase [Alphaproteobacteria bacterium]|nr:acyl--CoA ligase [Alphaproteobacteria bacterium]